MDDFNNEGLGYLFLILFGFSLILLGIVIDYFNLYRFKKCYENNFTMYYCEKYKTY
jgi:hypothetical protein